MAMSFICDVCGREVNGITIVNGMNFCAKCYQETFAIPKSLSVQDLENCIKIGCQQCEQKDQRIAELEEELASQNFNELVKKKYDSLKEAIKFLWEKQITDEHIFYVIDQLGQQHIDRIQDIENGICEIERLEKELAELKQNAIVPKFKINYIVWYIGNDKIQKGIIEEIRYYKTTGISYYLPNLQRETFWIYENELFATLAEAEEALKKLEEV